MTLTAIIFCITGSLLEMALELLGYTMSRVHLPLEVLKLVHTGSEGREHSVRVIVISYGPYDIDYRL